MKVKDLIKELEEFNPEADAGIEIGDGTTRSFTFAWRNYNDDGEKKDCDTVYLLTDDTKKEAESNG